MRRRLAIAVFSLGFIGCAGATTTAAPRHEAGPNAPYFVGDFNTCDFSQWAVQGPTKSFRIMRKPRREGRCAASLTVGPWARNGVVKQASDSAALWIPAADYGTSGRSVWQHFAVRFPQGFRATDGVWNWFAEWHNDAGFKSFVGPSLRWEYPNLCWTVRSKNGKMRIAMRIMGGASVSPRTVWVNAPRLKTDHWYDFLVRVVWSPDPREGAVEWWLDGRQLYSHDAATLYRRPDGSLSSVYFVLDNYRLHADWDATVLFDGARLGPTRAAVRYRHAGQSRTR